MRTEKKQHGGRREGAGRKAIYTEDDKPKIRGLRFTDTEWQAIKLLAEKSGLSARDYIVSKCTR